MHAETPSLNKPALLAFGDANMQGATTRLHWTDQAYKWHVNDGEEVFVVPDGIYHARRISLVRGIIADVCVDVLGIPKSRAT